MTDKIYMTFAKGPGADESEMKNIAVTIALSDIDSRMGIQAIIDEYGKQKGVEILSCLRKEAHKYKCVTLNRAGSGELSVCAGRERQCRSHPAGNLRGRHRHEKLFRCHV